MEMSVLIGFLIGTYTSPGGSEGVYQALLNGKTGELSELKLFAKVQNPSYLARNGEVLYAVSEKGQGEIWGFDPEGDEVNHLPTVGDYPCHLSIRNDKIFVANYNGGTVSRFLVSARGELQADGVFKNSGSGPNKERQDASHTHFVAPFKGFSFVCDLGTDELIALDNKDWGSKSVYKMQPGAGPRHAAFSPKRSVVYVTNELDCTVEAVKFDSKNRKFAFLNRLSTLPKAASRKGASTAEIRISPDERFVYVTNRGHHSIASYSIDSKGALKLLAVTPAGVKTPRGMNIDPSGNWLLVGGQDDDVIRSFRINQKTGVLTATGFSLKVSKPVDICF